MTPRTLVSGVAAALTVGLLACMPLAGTMQADAAAQAHESRRDHADGFHKFRPQNHYDRQIIANAVRLIEEGRQIFRYDTFGDEAYWGGKLGLNQTIAGVENGGTGPGLSPSTALQLGLKVDVNALPAKVRQAIKHGKVDLNDPAVTLLLLKLNAVVGVKGFFDDAGKLTSLGITCALCHSRVDDSFAPGIGYRLDGWPNRDLNVGAIVSFAPNLEPVADALGVNVATVRTVLASWGPGKYDAMLNLDQKAFTPDGGNAAELIPPAFGLVGQNLETAEGWGSVPYWNAYVAITQMHGKGTFFDPRLDDAQKFPLAALHRIGHIHDTPDLVTGKLAALQYYEFSLPAPTPPKGSFNEAAAKRGETLFNGKAQCSACHIPPLFSEPGWPMHTASEIGIDDFAASRSPDERYRTAPLAGLWAHAKGGYYHDGRFADLAAVVKHYNQARNLKLSTSQQHDLVEYLKSL